MFQVEKDTPFGWSFWSLSWSVRTHNDYSYEYDEV